MLYQLKKIKQSVYEANDGYLSSILSKLTFRAWKKKKSPKTVFIKKGRAKV